MRCALALAAALAGCTDELAIRPVIELPVGDEAANPFAAATPLDEITLTVARAGSDRELVSQTFARGEPITLAGAPFGEALVIHMTGFSQGGATSYGRTCAFEVDEAAVVPAPHLLFSRTVRFASLGVQPLARTGGHAVTLGGGAVILGGQVGAAPVLDVERFDPPTGQLVFVGRLSERLGAVEALLGTAPPRIAVLGGQVGASGASLVELIDPAQSVEVIEDVRMARLGITATSLTDGRVISIGGHAPGVGPVGTITEVSVNGPTVEIRGLQAQLSFPRTGHTATRLGDDVGASVLIAGGTSGVDGLGPPVPTAELFKPLTAELARPGSFAPRLLVPRAHHHAALLPDGSVLLIGGIDAAGNAVRTLELFSLETGFVAVGELPAAAAVVDGTVTVLPDGRLLLTGGRTTVGGPPTDYAAIARLDQLDGSIDIVTTDRLAVPRAGHQAALLCDGTVLISGGTDAPTAAERYNPPATGRR